MRLPEAHSKKMRAMKFLLLILILISLDGAFSIGQTVAGQKLPSEATRLMAEAQAAEAREDWKEAEESYLGVIRLAPDWAEVLVNLAVVYNREGKTAEAIDVLKGAAQLKPNLVEAHLNLGVTYFKTARYGDAVTSLRRAVAIAPVHVQARELLALALIALENFEE